MGRSTTQQLEVLPPDLRAAVCSGGALIQGPQPRTTDRQLHSWLSDKLVRLFRTGYRVAHTAHQADVNTGLLLAAFYVFR